MKQAAASIGQRIDPPALMGTSGEEVWSPLTFLPALGLAIVLTLSEEEEECCVSSSMLVGVAESLLAPPPPPAALELGTCGA